MASQLIIGIDNGISGGIVLLMNKTILDSCAMPVMAKKKGNEIDIMAVQRFVAPVGQYDPMVIIEEPGGSKNYGAAVSMAASFAALKTWCRLSGYRFEAITPAKWQKVMLPNCAKGQTKVYALTRARELWPNEDWRESEQCRKAHDGIVDAALIAEFGRRAGL